MTEREFSRKTLGLEAPWEVADVNLDLERKRVDVTVWVEPGTVWCEGGEQLPIAGYEELEWRHLDTMQLETVLGARVLEVCEERTTEAGCKALDTLGEEGLGKVRAVAMDMSAAYEAAVRAKCPRAAVVYDRYHVSAMLGGAVDRVRREEHAKLMAGGNDVLKGTRYDWLFDPGKMGEGRYARFEELLAKNTRNLAGVVSPDHVHGVLGSPGQGFGQRVLQEVVRTRSA